jgi:hemoglobin
MQQVSQNNFNASQNVPLTSKSGIPGTLFDKLGGDDGVTIFTDRVFAKVMEDAKLKPFFVRPGFDVSHLKVKFCTFITHMTGGSDVYQGKSIEEAHKPFPITDEIFDAFNSHCVQTLKEMRRLKVDGLKEMLRLLQNLRDSIVMKENPIPIDLAAGVAQ